jgi:5-methyltetrahydrofolate--homocysteine methyltransferase
VDLNLLKEAVVEMQEEKALSLTEQYLAGGAEPLSLFKAYQAALAEIGKRYEQEIYFIPELIMAGEMMNAASNLIKPLLADNDGMTENKRGKVLIATVKGDIHDIGKNIATMMMDLNGFEVKDIGVDVPGDRIIAEAEAFGADIIGLSGLLSLVFDPMKKLVEALKAQGLRDKYKVIIGGGQMDDKACAYIGADAFTTDAIAGVNICKAWLC